MECPSCGVGSRIDSVFCHQCGARLDSNSMKRGRGIFWTAFLLLLVIPAIYRTLVFINISTLLGIVDIFKVLDLILLGFMLLLFILLRRGRLWARYAIAAIVFSNQFLFLATLIRSPKSIIDNLGNIVTSLALMIIAFMLVLSKDIRAFVSDGNSISA